MNYIAKQFVFRDTRYWMHSIEWQKRGLPHAHILIWLAKKILLDQVNDIICSHIHNPETDSALHGIVIMNMIRGLCCIVNNQSSRMVNGKCSKRYPQKLTVETISGNDGYPLYKRRSPDAND